MDEYIGKTIPVKVIQTNPKRNRAVFSHRAVLMEEKAKRSEALWNSIHVDDIVDGVVKRFTDYGAFVDIGVHQDGLVHISQLTDRFVRHPSEVCAVGDLVTVWVLETDPAKKRISLTMKKPKGED